MNIERLLWIAEVYVLNVEENHQTTRIILPHGASFHGLQINLMITCESPKQEFMLLVSILCCTSKWHSVDGKFIILCLIIKVEAVYVQYRYVSNVANWKLITLEVEFNVCTGYPYLQKLFSFWQSLFRLLQCHGNETLWICKCVNIYLKLQRLRYYYFEDDLSFCCSAMEMRPSGRSEPGLLTNCGSPQTMYRS